MYTEMNKESFINLCNQLKDALLAILSEKKEDIKEKKIDFNQLSVMSAVSEIIDLSNGQIETDDENLRNVFREVFEAARAIKQNMYFVSHFKAEMTNAINNADDKKLEEVSKSFIISQKKLLQAYKDALISTDKALNQGKKK